MCCRACMFCRVCMSVEGVCVVERVCVVKCVCLYMKIRQQYAKIIHNLSSLHRQTTQYGRWTYTTQMNATGYVFCLCMC